MNMIHLVYSSEVSSIPADRSRTNSLIVIKPRLNSFVIRFTHLPCSVYCNYSAGHMPSTTFFTGQLAYTPNSPCLKQEAKIFPGANIRVSSFH